MKKTFVYPFNLYTDDIDFYGIAHHSNFLRYMERARNEWLASLGIKLNEMMEQHIWFAIKEADLEFVKPLRLGDQPEVYTEIEEVTHSTMVYDQTIRDRINHDIIYCRGKIRVVCINPHIKPRALPQTIVEKLTYAS